MLSVPGSRAESGRKEGAEPPPTAMWWAVLLPSRHWFCNTSRDKEAAWIWTRTIFHLEKPSLTFRSQPEPVENLLLLIRSQEANLPKLQEDCMWILDSLSLADGEHAQRAPDWIAAVGHNNMARANISAWSQETHTDLPSPCAYPLMTFQDQMPRSRSLGKGEMRSQKIRASLQSQQQERHSVTPSTQRS